MTSSRHEPLFERAANATQPDLPGLIGLCCLIGFIVLAALLWSSSRTAQRSARPDAKPVRELECVLVSTRMDRGRMFVRCTQPAATDQVNAQ